MGGADYVIHRSNAPTIELPSDWDGEFWRAADTLTVDQFHPASQTDLPRTQVRLRYDSEGLYVHFRVWEPHLLARFKDYQSPVCRDSCVEFFVKPLAARGYFNFEINALGTLMLHYNEDPSTDEAKSQTLQSQTLQSETLQSQTLQEVPASLGTTVELHASEREPVERDDPAGSEWWIQSYIPFSLFQPYLGDVVPGPGTSWRANFFKCGEHTAKPHWASWSSIGATLNFHQPAHFGTIVFR